MINQVCNFIYSLCPNKLRFYWDRINTSDIGSRLASGALWSIGGAVASRGLMLLTSIFVARFLGNEVYGEFGIIRSTVMTFVVFAGFGLGMTATKHVAEFRNTDRDRVGRILAISMLFAFLTGTCIAVGFYSSAAWLADNTLNAPHLTNALRVGSVVLLINAFNGAQTGALSGFEAFRSIAKVNVWVGLTSFPLLVGGAYLGGLLGAVYGLAINMGIHCFLNYLAMHRETKRRNINFLFKRCASEISVLWTFSVPATLSGIMVSPVFWICNVFLVNQLDGYVQVGIFDAANQWRIAILYIPSMVGQIVLPMLSSMGGEGDLERYKKVLRYNLLINIITSAVIALPIAIFSTLIMAAYGDGFVDGKWVLVILAISAVFVAVNSVVGQAIASKGKMWLGFTFNFLWGIALVSSSYILINICGYGAVGLALSYLFSYFLHSLWQFVFILRCKAI